MSTLPEYWKHMYLRNVRIYQTTGCQLRLHSFLNFFNQNVCKHTPLGVNVHVFSDNDDDPAEHHVAQTQTSISVLDPSAW